jgi:hypothetical protein
MYQVRQAILLAALDNPWIQGARALHEDDVWYWQGKIKFQSITVSNFEQWYDSELYDPEILKVCSEEYINRYTDTTITIRNGKPTSSASCPMATWP